MNQVAKNFPGMTPGQATNARVRWRHLVILAEAHNEGDQKGQQKRGRKSGKLQRTKENQ